MEDKLLEMISVRVRIHYLDFPGFCIADAYKMVYQGCMGPGHAITDPEAVKEWLDDEWESIEASSHEGIYSDMTVHTQVYRINLRAAKVFGISKASTLIFISGSSCFNQSNHPPRELPPHP